MRLFTFAIWFIFEFGLIAMTDWVSLSRRRCYICDRYYVCFVVCTEQAVLVVPSVIGTFEMTWCIMTIPLSHEFESRQIEFLFSQLYCPVKEVSSIFIRLFVVHRICIPMSEQNIQTRHKLQTGKSFFHLAQHTL